jgi:pimeloyl-ACP methyl ester carboxylesterase
MGGAVAVDVATRRARAAALVLVNSVGPRFHRGIFPRTYAALTWIADLHPVARQVLLATTKPIAHHVGFSKRLSDDELLWATRLCAGFEPDRLEKQLSGLEKPVFVAWAEDDPSIEAAISKALIGCTPKTEQLRFATGGHNLQSKQATELADAIVAWLEEARFSHKSVSTVCP